MTRPPGLLVLADGAVFEGEAVGALADGTVLVATGELVFNTVMSGYQEVITDPSYAGQVVAFTYPHIGNYGVTPEDDESRRPFCRGIVVRDLARRPSSWRAEGDLESFLTRHGIGGLTGVDTRRLTRHVREAGSMPCALGTAGEHELLAAARAEPGTEGVDLVGEVTVDRPYTVPGGPLRVVAYDFGLKRTILRHLTGMASVEVVPASTPAEEVLERRPDGVFLSNGPGDPAALAHLVGTVGGLLGRVPVFGICLGHQLLGAALGAKTFKLRFGHHGGNHPVRRIATARVEVTSQNHGYAVAEGTLEEADVTHVSLNDGVIEGLACRSVPAFGVQYHPEAGPGPHDARYLFEEFRRLMEARS
ncbi:MAG TPA: glutamine-hydrolyzing carbamoyl-phosphate synthase small subunit [Acidimicrobiales bacterium]|nr:glutamine-hydrolyzing carbamoyl-phosphate synthase small subunit [Acidimicrobiales bacterium]